MGPPRRCESWPSLLCCSLVARSKLPCVHCVYRLRDYRLVSIPHAGRRHALCTVSLHLHGRTWPRKSVDMVGIEDMGQGRWMGRRLGPLQMQRPTVPKTTPRQLGLARPRPCRLPTAPVRGPWSSRRYCVRVGGRLVADTAVGCGFLLLFVVLVTVVVEELIFVAATCGSVAATAASRAPWFGAGYECLWFPGGLVT